MSHQEDSSASSTASRADAEQAALPVDYTPRAALTNSKETPLFICAITGCHSLFPSRSKLVAHRSKDHRRTAVQSEGKSLWDKGESISYSDVIAMDEGEAENRKEGEVRLLEQ